jgi:hypothetical protein
MMLKAVGYWHSKEEWKLPDPHDLVDDRWEAEDRARIAHYLENAPRVIPWLGYSFCRFDCGTPPDQMGTCDMSDGLYLWPQGLAHYIRVHHVRLPEEFIEHMRDRHFEPPPEPLPPPTMEAVNDARRWWLAWAEREGGSARTGNE